MARKICSIDGCSKVAICRGWCSTHYQRWQTHGDPMRTDRLPPNTLSEWLKERVSHEGDECLIWPFSIRPDGYPDAVHGDGIKVSAHRFMCMLVHGAPPTSKHQAAHSCGKGSSGCVNPNHLSWKTGKQNQADRIAHGTSNQREQHPSAKLTMEDVDYIRSMKGKVFQRVLAEKFGVTRSHIANLQSGRLWK